MIFVKSIASLALVPAAPQPLIGQDEPGTLVKSYPTPAGDVQLTGNMEGNVENYVHALYGTPPPGNTNPDFLLVNEVPVDWKFYKRKYVQDRSNEGTYNASISYSAEATAFPIFTRDYIARRANYVAKAKLTALEGLINATVTVKGSGYTQATVSVSLAGGTGSGGAVAAIVSNGQVVQLVITAEGNYTVAPTVTINDSDSGTGATGTVSIQPITALLVKEDYIRQPDSDLDGLYVLVRRVYETLPGPILSGTHMDELTKIVYPYTKQIVASGTVASTITGAGVISLTIANGGTGFTGNPTLTFSAPGGGGVTATGTATFSAASPAGKLASVTLTNAGSGFTSHPTTTITDGGAGSGATATAVLIGVPIASVSVTAGGSGYTNAPAVALSDSGTGTGALAQVFLTPVAVNTITVDAGGSGYTSATVAFVGGGGSGAAATVHLTGNVITSITIDSAGTGYTSAPAVVISGDGTGGAAHANLVATSVASASVTSTGNLYQNPSAAFSGGGGSGATANVLLSPTQISSITLTAVGASYTSPVVAITGGGGSGAIATAAIATGTITSVAITNPGSGYTKAPTIVISGGSGTGASILAVIGALTWVEVEPLTAVKDLVLRTTVDLTTLPATLTLPQSFTVQRQDTNISTLILQGGTEGRLAVGLNEISIRGGQGPTLAFRDEMYMTDSQFAAYIPGVFSNSGRSFSTTMYKTNVDNNGVPQVWTFRPLTTNSGTSPGILQLTDQKKPYGIRFVTVIYLTAGN